MNHSISVAKKKVFSIVLPLNLDHDRGQEQSSNFWSGRTLISAGGHLIYIRLAALQEAPGLVVLIPSFSVR